MGAATGKAKPPNRPLEPFQPNEGYLTGWQQALENNAAMQQQAFQNGVAWSNWCHEQQLKCGADDWGSAWGEPSTTAEAPAEQGAVPASEVPPWKAPLTWRAAAAASSSSSLQPTPKAEPKSLAPQDAVHSGAQPKVNATRTA